jgi:uncharacterized protein
MTILDLDDIRLVDNHCHAFLREQPADLVQWRELFSEGSGPEIPDRHVPTTLVYQRMIRHLAGFFDCAPTEEAVLAARNQLDLPELTRRLFAAANIETLVLDTGFPPTELSLPGKEFQEITCCRIAPLLRLEIFIQGLIAEHDSLADVSEALRHELADVRASGFVGLKSIAAYRTGLDIRWWNAEEAESSFAQARLEVEEKGTLRLAHKPLLDTLLHAAFAQAARQELPVQFHTGYGDRDADMLLANPLHLRRILEHDPYRGMSVVLLHESYPYTRQGAYLAAVYERVYLDLSYAIPFLSFGEMVEFTRGAFGVAPISKLLYGSDAVRIPELYWLSAVDGRRVLTQVLEESLANGDLDARQALAAARSTLRENAIRLYGLESR